MLHPASSPQTSTSGARVLQCVGVMREKYVFPKCGLTSTGVPLAEVDTSTLVTVSILCSDSCDLGIPKHSPVFS